MRWPSQMFAQKPKNESENGKGDEGVEEAVGNKKSEAVEEVVDGLQQEGADMPVSDFCGDAPFVFGGACEIFYDEDSYEVEDHRCKRVIENGAIRFADCFPNQHGGEEWSDAEEAPKNEVPTVDESILEPDAEDFEIEGVDHRAAPDCF